MKVFIKLMVLCIILSLNSCGNWYDWMDEDGTGDAEDILIDAQMAIERGDYSTAAKYFSNCINKYESYDNPNVYFKKSTGASNEKIEFWNAYWDKKTDVDKNKILVQAYTGRATANIRRVLSIKNIIDIILTISDEDEQKKFEDVCIIEEIFNSDPKCGNSSDKSYCYERAAEVYKYMAPKIRDDDGNYILAFDKEEGKEFSSRSSIGEDLLRADKSHFLETKPGSYSKLAACALSSQAAAPTNSPHIKIFAVNCITSHFRAFYFPCFPLPSVVSFFLFSPVLSDLLFFLF